MRNANDPFLSDFCSQKLLKKREMLVTDKAFVKTDAKLTGDTEEEKTYLLVISL